MGESPENSQDPQVLVSLLNSQQWIVKWTQSSCFSMHHVLSLHVCVTVLHWPHLMPPRLATEDLLLAFAVHMEPFSTSVFKDLI